MNLTTLGTLVVGLSAAGVLAANGAVSAAAVAPGQYTVGATSVALTQPADALLGRIAPAAGADAKGMFGPQVGWPVIPVNATLLPNGHLLTHGTPVATAAQGGLALDDWNPARGMVDAAHVQTPTMNPYNSFCNALQTLPDGRLVMVGGNATMSTMFYNPVTKAESMGANLNLQRWYASVLRRPDDRILVLGGADSYNTGAYLNPTNNTGVGLTPEIGSGSGNWTLLNGATSTTAFGAQNNRWWYPRAFNAPDGNVFGISGNQLWKLNSSGAGSVTPQGTIPSLMGVSGAAVMYAPGRILIAGGGQSFNGDAAVATNATTLVDINGAAPAVTAVTPMAAKRNWLNLTVLPTGEVLANGGTINGTAGGAANADYTAELWNPSTKTWRAAATAQRIRTYHSTAVLMPTGAVFTGGGGVPGPEDNFNSETYYPPYLFTKAADGTVKWANRPLITSLSGSLRWGGGITLGTSDARGIASVSLISAATETHSVNTDQRRIPLAFTRSGSALTASIPNSRDIVPPGTYLLQAVDTNGVPSPSQLVTIRNGAAGSVTVYEADKSAANGIGGPGPAVNGNVTLAAGAPVGFESVNLLGYRIRHAFYTARIDPISATSPDLDKADSSFVARTGLASNAGFSFESANYPGYFLKVENGTVYLRQNDQTPAFAANATYLATTGLTGQNTSLALFSNPTLYLRHANFFLYAQPFDGTDLNRRDATFAVRAALTGGTAQRTTTTLVGVQSGKCLDLNGFNVADGAIVDIWTCGAGTNLKWTLDASGQLVNAFSGKCLDVAGVSAADGTTVQQWTCLGGVNQKWTYNPEKRTLVGLQSGKCLDVVNGNTANGARLVIWPCNGQINQQWTFV